ncbi:protein neprosin-like isoform X2 [Malania oleifera]|nr:protein neprosin-like isoform X2 [Malania oleifera]
MKPSFHPEGLFDESKVSTSTKPRRSSKPVTQLWHLKGECPEGTIPIRRTKREDVLRASSVQKFGKKHPGSISHTLLSPDDDTDNGKSHQHAIAYVGGADNIYFGAKATINVWKPRIQKASHEFSLAQFWILSGSFGQDLNTIEAGWQVNPNLYGDSRTRFFTYWTSDNYQATGCYNLLCSGFIQINSKIALGASIEPISGYGSSQFDISILVWKDGMNGHWWMQFGNEVILGYWPAFIFSHLVKSASMVQWGGEVLNSGGEAGDYTSTQMGSGHFPDEGYGKASYFKNLLVVDDSNNLIYPKGISPFTDQHNCYDIKLGNGIDWGFYFYFGGPGAKSSGCPL